MIPTLRSSKIILAPFSLDDAPLIEKYAGDFEVARTTLLIPHPYPKGEGAKWIASHSIEFLEKNNLIFSIRQHSGHLIGAINLKLNLSHHNGELGYWIGKPFWGMNYCTEAAQTLVHHGFTALNLNKIYACHMSINPASGRVMQKIGMTQEGFRKQHFFKNNQAFDIIDYGILRSDYEKIEFNK